MHAMVLGQKVGKLLSSKWRLGLRLCNFRAIQSKLAYEYPISYYCRICWTDLHQIFQAELGLVDIEAEMVKLMIVLQSLEER